MQPEPVVGDAFGELLRAVYRGGGRRGVEVEVIERDDGFVYTKEPARYFDDVLAWSSSAVWAVERASGRVLDIGVGAGRHALAAADNGCAVLGLDPSPGAVDVVRERGQDAIVGSIETADRILAGRRFDTLFLLGQNLGLLHSPAVAPELLTRLATLVEPGAIIVGTGSDPTKAPALHTGYLRLNRDRGRWPGQFTLRIRFRNLATDWYEYFMCTPDELEHLARGTGWVLEDRHVDGSDYAAMLRYRPDTKPR
ncbi:MAG: class I SAM-dependent methyltransferase [Acidimicrobiales bacterium]